jgi:Mn-dependent DtxR family transcriptional regulator
MPRQNAQSLEKPAKRRKLSSHHRSGLTESAEDYLECISNLIDRNGYASVSDVADTLDLIRPSVSIMIKRLADLGYLRREPYRGFVLTPKGESVASSIQERHTVLTELFQLMGMNPAAFQADIEGIEHHISNAALPRFKNLLRHLAKHPLPPGPYPSPTPVGRKSTASAT